MQLFDKEEFENYIKSNYEPLNIEVRHLQSDKISQTCDNCQAKIFLRLNSYYQNPGYIPFDIPDFETAYVECPNCGARSFIQLVVLSEDTGKRAANNNIIYKYLHYILYRLPEMEIKYEIKNIPIQYPTLINTVNEALFCMGHGKNVSAAIMFRRALQILAKDVLGGQGKTLYHQLEWLKENGNFLKIDLSELFHENSQLIKDVGNQASHPDDDITLHDFSKEDVDNLYDLFLIIINEVFIKPEKLKQIKEELKEKRKLK
jgi:hypothetical protein